MMHGLRIIIGLLLLAGIVTMLVLPRNGQVLGSYCTALEGRTAGQRTNALRAARALEGIVIDAGGDFSFNRAVGSWSPDRGYVVAPVSYDGELVLDWGGGVCQTSTTLYNAALIAGLQVLERHRHTWAPRYVPPGRDAAVAQPGVDLRLHNPYPYPVRLRVTAHADRVGVEILGRRSGPMASVESVLLAATPPLQVVKANDHQPTGQRRILTRGRPGTRVAVYRTYRHAPRAGTRELISQDTYPAMHTVISIGR